MKWLHAFLLAGTAIGCMSLAACHSGDQDRCQELVERQVKCNYQGNAALKADTQQALVETCRKAQKTLPMRTALDCLKASECSGFLTCRKEATELKGLGNGL